MTSLSFDPPNDQRRGGVTIGLWVVERGQEQVQASGDFIYYYHMPPTPLPPLLLPPPLP